MKFMNRQLTWIVFPCTLVSLVISIPVGFTQPILPGTDDTNTVVTSDENRFDIEGGIRSSDGNNLFHTFEKFSLESGQVANFLTDPEIRNILGRVTGGEASVIQGLIQVTGGSSNLFLMNPAGIIFGSGAALNVPADFTATTATAINFNNTQFNGIGANDYSSLNGDPSGYTFAITQPGIILNEGNLTVSAGQNLTLLGGTVINTGELSTPGGNITVMAVEGENLVRISQTGQLLNLEVVPLTSSSPTEVTINPLTLPELLTGLSSDQATTVTVNEQGQVILTGSNTIIPDQSGVAIASGIINTSNSELFNNSLGGNIYLFGDLVGVIDADLNASGINGGGTLLIGGSREANDTIPQATQTVVDGNSFISADALESGDGGTVIIKAEEIARFSGNLNAKGGTTSGNGGVVEISGNQNAVFLGNLDLSATNGTPGDIVFNLKNIFIGSVAAELDSTAENTPINLFDFDATNQTIIDAGKIGDSVGKIRFQADNNITVDTAIETTNSLEFQSGNSIQINADINTEAGNGEIRLQGNFDDADFSRRDAGTATITQQEGTTLNAGSGNILIELGSLAEVGEIQLDNVNTTGFLTINANGGNINRVAETSLITAGDAIFQTTETGGIGTESEPMRISLDNLEANAGTGGIFLEAVQGLIIGDVTEDLTGISTEGGGEVFINVTGDLTVQDNEQISTSVEDNQTAGEITLISQGMIDIPEIQATSEGGDGGNITLNAEGNIIVNQIESNSLNIGNGGEIFLESSTGTITVNEGGIDASAEQGNGGSITLNAADNILLSSLSSQSTGTGNGGEISVVSQNGNLSTDGDINTSATDGNGGNIFLTAADNIILSRVFSPSTVAGNGGQILAESQNGNLSTEEEINASATAGTGGEITLTATNEIVIGGDIISNSQSEGDGGEIKVESIGSSLDTTASDMNTSAREGQGGNVSLIAEEKNTVSDINTRGLTQGGNITLTSRSSDVDTTAGELNYESETGNPGLLTITSLGGDVTVGELQGSQNLIIDEENVSADTINNQTGEIKLQAHNDITFNQDIQTDTVSALEVKAGRSININANIDTSAADGRITLQANSPEVGQESLRETGVANIMMAEGTTLNSGQGDIVIEISNFGEPGNIGNIILNTIQTTGTVTVNANGGTIQRTSANALITAENGIFQTQNAGGIGSVTEPLLLNVNHLEAVTGRGGGFFNAPNGNITIGGATPLLTGISALDGDIELTASGDILIQDSESVSTVIVDGTGGNITLKAGNTINTTGGIIESSASEENAGSITLSATNDIATRHLYSNSINGNAGNITLESERGSINTTQGQIYSFSNQGKAGDITLTATNDINTANLFTGTFGSGNGGNINLTSTAGSINTTLGEIYSASLTGDTGNITLSAAQDIESHQINVASAFNAVETLDPTTETSTITLEPQERTTGTAGNIQLETTNGTIDTTGGVLNSESPSGSGNIVLNSNGNISTGLITTAALNATEATPAGTVQINSNSGTVNLTQPLQSFSRRGTAGNVSILAGEDITISQGIQGSGYEQGGNILNQSGGTITIQNSLETFSENGRAGEINLTANDNISINEIRSQGLQKGGDISLTSVARNLNITPGNIETFSLQGVGGNVTLQAANSINTNNILTYGNTQSGNVIINSQANTISTQNLQTVSPNGTSGNITLNTFNFPGNIEFANLSEVDGTPAGNVTIQNPDGSVRVENLPPSSTPADAEDTTSNNAPSETNLDEETSLSSQGTSDPTNGTETSSESPTITSELEENSEHREVILPSEEVENTPTNSEFAAESPTEATLTLEEENPLKNFRTSNETEEENPLKNFRTGNSNDEGTSETRNTQSTDAETLQVDTPETTDTDTSNPQSIRNNSIAVNAQVAPVSDPTSVALNILPELEQSRTAEFQAYFGDELPSEPLTSASVREVLTQIHQQTGNRSAVVYVTLQPQQLELVMFDGNGKAQLYTVEVSRQEVLKLAREFVFSITSARHRQSNSYLKSAQQLYQWLIKPLEAQLQATSIDTLLFSMDAGLRSLPLAALHDGQQFLVQKYSLSLIPSISLMDTQYRPLKDAQVLGMGASEFNDLPALPAVPVELEIITQELRQGRRFLNSEFTQENLLKQRQDYPYRIIHLATHSQFKAGDLNESYIQLWQDERLYLSQLRQLKLNSPAVDLLVLSSCRTALGDEQAELGFAGLAVQAGVKSALASLWYVNDEGTLGLMSEFYAALNSSPIKAEALRQAQIAMIKGKVMIEAGFGRADQQNFSHPYYWSGFTMVGSPW